MTVAIVGVVAGSASSGLTIAAKTAVVALGIFATWKGYCIWH
jgi:hypothetical protein